MAGLVERSAAAAMLHEKVEKMMAGREATSFGKRNRLDGVSRPLPAIEGDDPIGDKTRKRKSLWPDDKKNNWTILRSICGVLYVLLVTVGAMSVVDWSNKMPKGITKIDQIEAEKVAAARKSACARDDSGIAFTMAQSEVSKRLATPSSARYPVLESRTQPMGDCLYRIIAVVESQDGLGAVIRTPWSGTIQYHPDDGTWQVKSLKMGS